MFKAYLFGFFIIGFSMSAIAQHQTQITGQDQYGRWFGTIYHNNQNINKVMVRDGMAWAYKKYVIDQEYFRLEKQARDAKRGLWSHPNPIYPATFRYNQRRR